MSSSPRLRRKITPLRLVVFTLASAAFLITLQLSFFSARAVSPNIIISEFRTRGPAGGNDEFIELYNNSAASVNISGWKIKGSNNAGSVSTRATVPVNTILNAGCRYLVTNNASGGYSGSAPSNLTYSTGITDDGGIAVTLADDTIVDQVGMSSGSAYKEGTPLASFGSTNSDRSYERKAVGANAGSQDTDNNANDFVLRSPSNPQNAAAGCLATNLSATGAANPNSVATGSSTLLTVTVTPGSNPTSTGIAVTGNLSSIGGSSTQQFFDNGSNGDVTAGDNVFSFQATVSGSTGSKSLPITVSDAQSRSTTTSISLTVTSPSTNPSGTGAANPSTVNAGSATLLTVTVTPGTNPVSTGIAVTGNLSSIGGSASQQFYNDGTHGDATSGDSVFSFNATVSSSTSAGAKTLPITITDAQSRSGTTSISLTVQAAPVLPGAVVISQVYGGGGNSGATLKNDYIELFNRSSNVVDLTGWSVQYVSATGTGSWSGKTTLSGTIPPGGYYLIQEAQGTGGSVNLPTPDAIGTIPMGATAGKVALVNNSTTLTGCPSGSSIIDLVGYGTTATCSEGNNPTANLGNTIAAIRTHGGCKDTDNNGLDFKTGQPNPRNSSTSLHICPIGDLEPEVFTTTPGDAATSIPLSTNITVQFDEPVNVTSNWFNISCATSGIHTATVTGGPTTFTLNPDTDFLAQEQCTVTVYASQVTDQDSIDPPDNMAADYTWSFLTGHDPQVNLTMGNPSNAIADPINSQDNYLMEKDQYTLSYNRSKATPNWVSWQLDQTWLGSTSRQDTFRADDTLPTDWYHVLETDYQFSTYGFDRGHMCPSADRTATVDDNSNTFLMTNMVPQASGNNQGPWALFENYLRTQIAGGNRVYIVSGPAGQGGISSTGSWNTINTPTGGTITVPAYTWKVALIVPTAGDNDVSKVNSSTRTIAVIMPNHDDIRPDQWQRYLATVDQVEALSGYDFFSNVPTSVQAIIESRLDTINDTAPVAANQSASVSEDSSVRITLTATDFNVNNVLSFTPSNPAHGQLSNIGTPSCALVASPDADAGKVRCTVNATYTPNADYNGPDSFTYTANDAGLDSSPATVTISVAEENDAPTAAADSKTTSEDTPLTFAASDLTSNDVAGPANESGQSLTVTRVNITSDTHGTVTLDAGQITYTPTTNYNGSASFTYTVCDNGTTGGLSDPKCDTATVSVTVNPVNDAPVANNQTINTNSNTPVSVTLTGSDVETPAAGLTYTVTSGPANGSLSGTAPNLVYTPAQNSCGTDSFKFTVTDNGDGLSAPLTSSEATVSITIKDTVSPTINTPSDIITTAAPGADSAAVNFTPTASDNCGGVRVESSPASGSSFSLGTTTVQITATDDAGNTSTGSFTVTVKAITTVVLNCPTSTAYTGSAIEPCTATVTGAGGLNEALTVSYTNNVNAGTATASASYAGAANYVGSSGSKNFEITKAVTTTTVTVSNASYDGNAHGGTAIVTGAGGLNQNLTILYSGRNSTVYSSNDAPTNAGDYTASASFAGDSNYAASSDSKNFSIAKASQTINFGALADKTFGDADFSVSATSNSGLAVAFAASPQSVCTVAGNTVHIIGAGSCTITASQSGDTNYNPATDVPQSFTVAKASSTTTVSVGNAQYDGNMHGGTAAVTGAGGLNQSLTVTYTGINGTVYGPSTTTPSNAGDYTASASFGGDVNHEPSTDSKNFQIAKISATINVNGYTGVYDGQSHGATGTATGITGENLTNLLNFGSSFTNVPGGTADWSFAGNTNYLPASGTANIVITKATPTFGNLASPTITYGTASTSLSGKISLGSLIPTGSVAITLNGVTQNAVIQAGGNFSTSFATAQLAPSNPPYSIAYSYGGDGNFSSASGTGTLTVGYSFVALYDQTAVHTSGSTIPIKLKITNASGNNLSSSNIGVTAVGVSLISTDVYGPVQDAGNANPDNNFRFSDNSYIFNLQTTGLATGVYNLYFRVGSDPTLHTVQFKVK